MELTTAELRVLKCIKKENNPVSGTKLATRLRKNYYLVLESLDHLKEKGFLIRKEEGAYLKWSLTGKAAKLIEFVEQK